MSTREITIQGITAVVRQPYAAGHVLTEAEAKSLNQTWAENIRNNCATLVKKAIEAANGEPLPDAEVSRLRAEVEAYDAAYQFTFASAGGGRKTTDPVEAEARRMAKAAITASLKAKGQLVKNVDKDKLESAIAQLAGSEKYLKAAKKAVDERAKTIGADLEGLDL